MLQNGLLGIFLFFVTSSRLLALEMAYVVNRSTDSVTPVNLMDNSLRTPIDVGVNPFDATISPDGRRVYVSNTGSDSVSAIDTQTGTVVETYQVGSQPMGITTSIDGHKVYVANFGSNSVSVISMNTVSSFPTGSGPMGIAIGKDGLGVVSNRNDDTLTLFDPSVDSPIGSPILVGSNPTQLSISADSSLTLVSNESSNSVDLVEIDGGTIEGSAQIQTPRGNIISLDGTIGYIASETTDTVVPLDLTTFVSMPPINVGDAPASIAMNTEGTRLYVTNELSNDVTQINLLGSTVLSTVTISGFSQPFGIAVGMVPPLAVSSFIGISLEDVFEFQTDYVNRLIWSCNQDPTISAYELFRNGKSIAVIPCKGSSGEVMVYDDHNRHRGELDLYELKAVNKSGSSSPITTTVKVKG